MTEFPDVTSPQKAIRVFVVDNEPAILAGVQQIVELAPERDLVFVGAESSPESDITRRLVETGTDVVVVDLSFDFRGDKSGVALIREIRRSLGANIGIVVYTSRSNLDQESLDAGADIAISKGAANDRFRNGIRQCKKHAQLLGVSLDFRMLRAHISVKNDAGCVSDSSVTFLRDDFALLWYLSAERAHRKVNWLVRMDPNKGNQYQFVNSPYWDTICKRLRARESTTWEDEDISKHASSVNSVVKRTFSGSLESHDDVKLIVVPGPGRKSFGTCIYSINWFLEPDKVVLQGDQRSSPVAE